MNIVVVGSSGHAKVVIDIIEREGQYTIAGLLDDFRPVGEEAFGYKILGKVADLAALVEGYRLEGGTIAVGDNWKRAKIAQTMLLALPGFSFITAIHPSAQIARGVHVGRGTVIMAGVVVNSDSQIGNFCILNTRSSLDHDCVMEDFSSLAPGATTGGNVHIGAFSAISLGANILQGRCIGSHTVIGAGALVVRDIPDHSLAYGVPARVIRHREEGESYLETRPSSSAK
ncbi:MAG: acetyltransferase [Anaerolineae bacterium]|nr:acetyltransferase [Anaerolineae bacterium]